MKTLSAATETAFDSPHVAPVYLVTFEISTATLYFCDRVWGSAGAECVFDGNLYEPLLINFNINSGAIDPVTFETDPGQADLQIDDTAPVGGFNRLSEMLFAFSAAQFAEVTISVIPENATVAADAIVLFKGAIEDPSLPQNGVLSLRCSGFELVVSRKFSHDVCDSNTYENADPDDLGKMLPQVYGTCKRVPFLAVDAGAVSTLVANITKTQTTITLTDSSRFPTSGTVQIESEQITYTGNSSSQLTGCTRGANSTMALTHVAGAGAAEIQSDYFYAIGHAVKAIDADYVENVAQSGNHTDYTGQSGDQHATYGALAVKKFTAAKIQKKLWHNMLIHSAHKFHSDSTYVGSTRQIDANEYESWSISCTEPWWVPTPEFDRSIDGYATYWNLTITIADFGTTGHMYVDVYDSNDGSWRRVFEITDGVITYQGPNPFPIYVSGSNYPTQLSILFKGEASGLGAFDGDVTVGLFDIALELFRYGEDPTGGVAFSGNSTADALISGRVSADVDGFQDDGAGTYTGSADALIERPDHIAKHIIIDRCGLSSDYIDSTSYTASGTQYAAASMSLGICILERPNVRNLLSRIAKQSKSIEFWEAGVHHLKYIEDTPDVDGFIDQYRIDAGQIWTKYTLRAAIENKISANFYRLWAGYKEGEEDRGVVTAVDSDSVAVFGELTGEKRSYPYISTQAHAETVLLWEAYELAFPRLIIEFAGGLDLSKYERGDVIQFKAESGDYLDSALSGLLRNASFSSEGGLMFDSTGLSFEDAIALQKFRVINTQHRPGTTQLEVVAVRGGTMGSLYAYGSLTDLAALDGAVLADGDGAVVISDDGFFAYLLDASSGASENSPYVISPDTNAGSKRWLLKNPNRQVYFRALHTSSPGPNTTIDDWTTVPFAAEAVDLNGDYNAATGVFTAPYDGIYHLSAAVLLTGIDRDIDYFRIQIVTSNYTYDKFIGILGYDPGGYASYPDTLHLSVIADMDAADTAYVRIYQSGGTGTANIDPGGNNFFCGGLIREVD